MVTYTEQYDYANDAELPADVYLLAGQCYGAVRPAC